MATNPIPLIVNPSPTHAKRVCGICKTPGHDHRNCPQRQLPIVTEGFEDSLDVQNGVDARVLTTVVVQATPQMPPRIDWDESFYVLFDLETTGGLRVHHNIIELAVLIVGPDSIMIEDGIYQSFLQQEDFVSTTTSSSLPP